MSVFRARKRDKTTGEWGFTSPYYHYDFVLTIDGHRRRFHGSTGETTKSRAQKFEDKEKRRVRDEGPNDNMTLGEACLRYHEEVIEGTSNEINELAAMKHCCRLIGSDRRLTSLTTDDIAIAVRKRAGETKGKKNPTLIAPATVNRQIIEIMRKVLKRAKRVWHVRLDLDAYDWAGMRLKEPKERVREFVGDEADRFWDMMRADYAPFVWFLLSRGLRVNAVTGMSKDRLDEPRNRIQIWIKGEGWVWVPVTKEQMAVIVQEAKKAPGKAVWSYEMQRHPHRGKRRPITYNGFRRTIQTALKAAGITDFRIHDLRHDFASKLLRKTRDLALVQKALKHADISSTVRYAHVLDEDVREGLEALENIRPLTGNKSKNFRRN
ncbi:tyrosine-type recombinase/integrase [Roseibium sediminicola]|uniref:Tyrosine-type recombinase/integrase n=1 Tax=Roseibium sediminicola TaxID=2933272 RepID=A0ABT0GT81_9HYPH|nr:tyrosine-type recombinase/integrase [Roseibium sp. CAU 1639]MCK7611998.1 tyrosine-type recombinase/integrase [Roseibium sp. CAU 1639]